MNRTKQSVLNDLITLMNATQDAAITSIEVAETDRPHSYQPALTKEPIPSNPSLAQFNVASELAKRILNDQPEAATLVNQYQPGIIAQLIEQHQVDYENPRNVVKVVNRWLGIASLDD